MAKEVEQVLGHHRLVSELAIDTIMGHAPDAADMGAVYTDTIEDSRLVRVAEHYGVSLETVRGWIKSGLLPATEIK